MRFPTHLFPPIVLGDRSIAECREFYPDVSAGAREERLFNTLFPKMKGHLYQIY